MNIRTLVLLVILAIVCPPITGGAIGFHTPFGSSGGGGTATDITFDNTKASIPNDPDTVQEMGEELKTLIDNVGTTGVNFSGMAETTDTTGIDSRQMILENSGTVNKITWANIISAIKASLTGFFQPDDADLDSLSSGITGPVLGLGDGSGYQALQLASELALTGTTLGLNATLDLSGYTITFGLEASDIPNRVYDPTPESDASFAGDLISVVTTAGLNAVAGDLVCIVAQGGANGPIVALADATDGTKVGATFLITESINAGNAGNALVSGVARLDSWNWSGVNKSLFIGTTAGDMTETAPSAAGQYVQKMGYSLSPDVILFRPSVDIGEVN